MFDAHSFQIKVKIKIIVQALKFSLIIKLNKIVVFFKHLQFARRWDTACKASARTVLS